MPGRWYLVRTKAGAEKLAELHLRRQGFLTYLPLTARAGRSADKHSAYFPGYLFVSLDVARDRWRSVNGTIGVVHLITAQAAPLAVPNSLMETLLRATDDAGVLRRVFVARAGDRVRIVSGAFCEHDAVVEALAKTDRVRVLMSLMQRELRVEMPSADCVVAYC